MTKLAIAMCAFVIFCRSRGWERPDLQRFASLWPGNQHYQERRTGNQRRKADPGFRTGAAGHTVPPPARRVFVHSRSGQPLVELQLDTLLKSLLFIVYILQQGIHLSQQLNCHALEIPSHPLFNFTEKR